MSGRFWSVLRNIIPDDEPHEEETHWVTRCPDPRCPCSTPEWHKHLYINADEGIGYCFRCGKAMSIERFISLSLGIDRQSAMFYAYGDRRSRRRSRIGRKSETSLLCHDQLPPIPSVRLPKGGVEATTHPYLQQRNIRSELAEEKGLLFYSEGPMKDRIVVPLKTHDGRIVGYSGRSVNGSRLKNLYMTGLPKSKIVYNEIGALGGTVVLVEGELGDAFSVMRVTPHVCALYGKQIHPLAMIRLYKIGAREVLVMLDGKEDPVPPARKLLEMGFQVRIVVVPYHLDPGDMSPREIACAINNAKEIKIYRRERSRRWRQRKKPRHDPRGVLF